MKKLYFVLLLIIVSFGLAIAGDTIKVLRIYNGGVGTTIPLTNIDSINHSKYDADSVLNADYITSVTWAIDSIYKIPINSIDSAVVTEIDVDEYLFHIANIQEYIESQGEKEVYGFQKDFMIWLDEQDWVNKCTINDSKDLITITFVNGIEFFIDFQDASYYQDVDVTNSSRTYSRAESLDEELFIDVSFKEDEKIIEEKEIMYIEGRSMAGNIGTDYIIPESAQLTNIFDESPLGLYITPFSETLEFLKADFSKYGIVIISQTHGISDNLDGSFQVKADNLSPVTINGLSVEVYKNPSAFDIIMSYIGEIRPRYVYWVKPRHLSRALAGNTPIIFGNYCWSYHLQWEINNGVIFGYSTRSGHSNNVEKLLKFSYNMLNGKTYEQSIEKIKEDYAFKTWREEIICKPMTNEPKSKQRYFSISTEDINKNDVGFLVIKGKINGYDNLKKDELKNSFFVYCHEGGEDFTPESDNIEKFDLEINEDGTFEKLLYADATYGFIAGFEYKDKVYYGEMKTYIMDSGVPCPDNNHPHMVDLGLPSGTKWACCNLGASKPEDYGNYYAWGTTVPIEELDEDYDEDEDEFPPLGNDGDISGTEYDVAFKTLGSPWRMPDWEMSQELLKECSKNWTTINGINGLLLTGPNGNYIFMPANGTWDDGTIKGLGLSGNYWTSELEDYFTTAHSLFFKGSEGSLTSYVSWSSYWYGHGVRPVSK